MSITDSTAENFSYVRPLRERQLDKISILPLGSEQKTSEHKAKIFFSLDKLGGERKPFILRSEGAVTLELKLSSIRASIFLVMLLDLQDRLEKGPGISDILEKVIEFYCVLDPAAKDNPNLKSIVRVGLYRFEFYLEEIRDIFKGKASIIFKSARPSIELKVEGYSDAELIVSSTDQKILLLLEKASSSSPLSRLRKHKSLYVPSGDAGWERLFLEFFDHTHNVKNTSLFYRFALTTYPDNLLKKIGVADVTFKRKNIVLNGYQKNRIEFFEYISRDTLWDTISLSKSGGFKLYPKHITRQDVKEHLEAIIFQLNEYKNYNVYLTNAPFPFLLNMVEILSGNTSELFTLFYRQYLREAVLDRTCFAINDSSTAQSVSKSIINSVDNHPSTLCKKNAVIEEIEKVLKHLVDRGPKLDMLIKY